MRLGMSRVVGSAPYQREAAGAPKRPYVAASIATLIVTMLATASSATASVWFSVVGQNRLGVSAALRVGALASQTTVGGQPVLLAVAPDGSFAFSIQGPNPRLAVVRGGRVATIIRGIWPQDIVYASDGALIAVESEVVWRVDPQGVRSRLAGRRGKEGSAGDGGPATAATLNCAHGVDVDAAGGILIADECARRIRRISPDGLIETVAGNGKRGGGGDGGPATAASLNAPDKVIALPTGGFALLDGKQHVAPSERIRVVDSTATITTRSRAPATELAAEPDGSVLLVDWTFEHARRGALVSRVRPDGIVETVVARSQRADVGFYSDGCLLEACDLQIDSVARTADGSLLIGGGHGVLYAPSATPGLLAVALGADTRVTRPTLRAAVRLTRPAHVQARVLIGSRLVAERQIDLPAGESPVEFPELTRPAIYTVQLTASADADATFVEGEALAGGLPASFARYITRWTPGGPSPPLGAPVPCRTRGAWRQDCRVVRKRYCLAIVTVRVLPDGALKKTWRRGAKRPRCQRRSG
jgi:hypothetical protein